MAAWKSLERRVAKLLGGVRTGNTGTACADVLVGDWLAVECKYKAQLPQWLKHADDQVQAAAGDTRLGMVVLFEKGRRTGDSLCLMRLSDFEEWFGGKGSYNPSQDSLGGAQDANDA